MSGSLRSTRSISAAASSTHDLWVLSSSILLAVAGVFSVVHGLAALGRSDYLADQLLFSTMDAWGRTLLVWGVVQVLAGGYAVTGSVAARGVGIGVAIAAGIVWFLMMYAAPVAALVGIGFGLAIVYGLTAPRVGARDC